MLTQSAQRQRAAYTSAETTFMVLVGTAKGNRWLHWMIATAPVEPVPGSPGQAATRN